MKVDQVEYTCDECGQWVVVETSAAVVTRVGYVSPLTDWYKVNKHGEQELHFCSASCLLLWAEKK